MKRRGGSDGWEGGVGGRGGKEGWERGVGMEGWGWRGGDGGMGWGKEGAVFTKMKRTGRMEEVGSS